MSTKFISPTLFLLIFIFFNSTESKAQFRDFYVEPCTDSLSVINLFDSVFFSNLPPQTISNLTFKGDPTAVGYFSDGFFLGFDSGKGIVLTTGSVQDCDHSNICNSSANASTYNNGISGDEDLVALLGGSTQSYDACIIEFDFKPVNESIEFEYVFASEEYHEYVFASFNDVMGMFLSGEEISGPYSNNSKNIALIPGTNTAVSINNINFEKGGKTCEGKPPGCTNCQYFKDNSQSSDPAFNKFVYDALTVPLMTTHNILHGKWYHIKIVIGDAGDHIFDSALFLGKKSFKTGYIQPNYSPMIMD